MASLTYKLEKLLVRHLAGKRAVVKIAGVPHRFTAVRFGGVSPMVCLEINGQNTCRSAAEWRRMGADF